MRQEKRWQYGGEGARRFARRALLAGLMAGLAVAFGCGTSGKKQSNNSFFTSGSKEADQRASQRMAKAEQLSGSGEAGGEKGAKKPGKSTDSVLPQAAQAPQKMSLFERLGGEKGLTAMVDDFMPRLLQDPRVNFERKGVRTGGLFHRGPAVNWNPTPQHVAELKKRFVEFLALATGGPAHYQGKEIAAGHASMHISNPEFDAAIGDIKASLDKLQIPNQEQKELLAVVESTRPQIVTVR